MVGVHPPSVGRHRVLLLSIAGGLVGSVTLLGRRRCLSVPSVSLVDVAFARLSVKLAGPSFAPLASIFGEEVYATA